MASSLDLSALSAFTLEEKAPIFTAALLADNTTDLFTKVDGIKSSVKLPKLETTVPAQAGTACSFNSSGATTITQTTLSTTPFTVQEEMCLYDLEGYFTQAWLPNGTKPDTAQFISMMIDRKINKIAQNVARTLVQGKTTYTNSTWLKLMNGYVSLIDTAGTAVAATQQASVSTSTVRGIVEEIVFQKIPNRVLSGNPVLAMDISDFRILLQKLWVDNLYHFMPGSNMQTTTELVYPGSNVTVKGVYGFSSDNDICETGVLPTAVSHRMLAFRKENLLFGFDTEADLRDFDVWYDKNTRMLRFYLRGRIGVGVHDYTEIVQYKNT